MRIRLNKKGFTLIELLIVVAIIGIIAAIAIPNLLNAIQRGKQKRTMADMRAVGTAVEAYAVDNNLYPPGGSNVSTITQRLGFSNVRIKLTMPVSNNVLGRPHCARTSRVPRVAPRSASTPPGTADRSLT